MDKLNKESVVDILQSIVEIVTYGDKHDSSIFECFMEYQVLAEFVRVLKISRNSIIEAPLLQYLSIMIQNMESEHAIYYCFSNDYINSIITHPYEFDGGDLVPYYISFLRAVSGKINRDTLCLLIKVHEDVVVSFPLYTEALKFASHGEKMIQIAVRALTLNIYNVSDDMVFKFVTTPPISEYFSDLVKKLREQCSHLDALVHAAKETCTHEKRNELLLETDKIVDDLYYYNDILCVGDSRLSRLITQNLLSLLVFPILLPLLHVIQSSGTNLSAITSLYIVSRLLQVVDGKYIVNFVASVVLYPSTSSSVRGVTEGDTTNGISQTAAYVNHSNKVEEMVRSCLEFEGSENYKNGQFGNFLEHISTVSRSVSFPLDSICKERSGILSYIFSGNHSLLLSSLLLLLILAESRDLDSMLASMIGFSRTKITMPKMLTNDTSSSQLVGGNIFLRHMPQILNELLKILASQPPFSVLIQWHTGWFLRKLLILQEIKLSDYGFQLFSISYEQSRERLQKELDGCWFDLIPDTLRNSWTSCKTALEESSQSKDPLFTLELDFHQQTIDGNMVSSLAWQRMVDAVKVFILHLQLKAFILKGDPAENPLVNLRSNILAVSGKTHASDLSSASFGSQMALGSGVPCKIAFSKVGVKDIFLLPVAKGISGKLLLLEKHPLHGQRGVVIADAPLAGLNPKIDENHSSWLHLQIREFNPKFDTSKIRGYHSSESNRVEDARWTLGFINTEACEAAQVLILKEIRKQRSSVENLLAPLLEDNSLGDFLANQGE